MITQHELLDLQKKIALKSDRKAFKALFESVSPELCKFACQYVTIEEAEEVVYLVLTRLWSNRKTLQNIVSLDVYLYKAVRFEVIKVNKKKKRFNLVVLDNETEASSQEHFCAPVTPESILATKELHNYITRQIDSLPPKCRMAFKMVKEDGLKYSEVAEIMSVSKSTIENHVSKALKLLKAAIMSYQKSEKSIPDKLYKNIIAIFLIFFLV